MPSNSILNSVKKALGLGEEYTPFDEEIIMYVNSVFATLTQIGIGPLDGFEIYDANPIWDQYLLGNARFNFVKTYMSARVRILFDSGSMTAATLQAFKENISEFEARISLEREAGHWAQQKASTGTIVIDGGNSSSPVTNADVIFASSLPVPTPQTIDGGDSSGSDL